VRGNHELEARTQAADETPTGTGVMGATDAEHGPVVSEVDLALQAEQPTSGTAPAHRSLASRGVVLGRGGDRVIAAAGDGVLVIVDRVGSHHPHPRHAHTPSANWKLQTCSSWFVVIAGMDVK
jgi:hypothetical protein